MLFYIKIYNRRIEENLILRFEKYSIYDIILGCIRLFFEGKKRLILHTEIKKCSKLCSKIT